MVVRLEDVIEYYWGVAEASLWLSIVSDSVCRRGKLHVQSPLGCLEAEWGVDAGMEVVIRLLVE